MKARGLRNIVFRIDSMGKAFSLFLLYVGGLVYKELKTTARLNYFKRIKFYFKGFTSESVFLYQNNPEKYNINLYITDYQRYNKAPRLNERHGIILADKNLFNDFFYKYRHFLPTIYAEIINGKIIPNENDDYNIQTIQDIQQYLKERKALVFKPEAGYGGRGIVVCKYLDDELWINNDKAGFDQLEKLIREFDKYQLSEFAFQADYANEIFNRTANTIRVLSIYDKDTSKARVVAAIHRFGTNKSYPVDNFTKGSLSTYIDLETGELGLSASHAVGGKVVWVASHPDSNAQIKGVKIHNWEFIKENIVKLAEYSNYTPLIGWDVISTNDGIKIIEANDSPGVDLIQIHKPLLLNRELKSFYQKHQLLKKNQIKAAENWYAKK